MKWIMAVSCSLMIAAVMSGCCSPTPCCSTGKIQRIQMVTGIKPDQIARYKDLHAHAWPSVNRMITACNIRNFSIAIQQIGQEYYLFAYFEYTGKDLEADMKKMAADPETRRWWKETDPCQLPLPGAAARKQIWTTMEEVYYLK